ncbi:acyl-CoA carboxylase epsilon subunit [Actinomycetota bacterium Odt1-20B]
MTTSDKHLPPTITITRGRPAPDDLAAVLTVLAHIAQHGAGDLPGAEAAPLGSNTPWHIEHPANTPAKQGWFSWHPHPSPSRASAPW